MEELELFYNYDHSKKEFINKIIYEREGIIN